MSQKSLDTAIKSRYDGDNMKFSFTFKPTCEGFTFLEILLSLFILSVAILGVASLQLAAFKNIQQTYFHGIAQTQLTSMIERLRVNQSSAARNQACYEWNQENQRLLPAGRGECSCSHQSCNITLVWKNGQLASKVQL